ncbi:hypothetical protein BVRB_006750 [Beta vulgaris subsp. vulgaris]|uniref:Uncharacterized protein n=1 Tax=Beta vulgaris subsp. vulgaris TaxID=3555 RepID=A0A0J8B3P9_BETVV|nr:hypothetical protein BVRB_006750 [Beta vulgaris subsp. vulgaris]
MVCRSRIRRGLSLLLMKWRVYMRKLWIHKVCWIARNFSFPTCGAHFAARRGGGCLATQPKLIICSLYGGSCDVSDFFSFCMLQDAFFLSSHQFHFHGTLANIVCCHFYDIEQTN